MDHEARQDKGINEKEMPEMMTMTESAARHLAAGVEDLDELARLVEADTGKTPNRKALSDRRSYFRRYGIGWVDATREASREASKRWLAENPDKKREKKREKNRRWYVENPEKAREATRRWKADNPARTLLLNCRRNAKVRGQECTITADDIEALLAPMTCSATGLPLTLEHEGGTTRNPWAPSIDRLDNALGYVPGNVRVVCVLYNLARNDFPDEALLTMAKALAARAP